MKIGKFIFRMRMKQGQIKKRGIKTTFDNFVAGSAELSRVTQQEPARELCFIVPISEAVKTQQSQNYIDQLLVERFAVVVCLKTDMQQSDRYGFLAYDKIHDVREEVFKAFLGWQVAEAESPIRYRGGSLIDFRNTYLWYQFEFEYDARLFSRVSLENEDNVEGGVEVFGFQDVDIESPYYIDKIYTEYFVPKDGKIPLDPTQGLPVVNENDVVFPDIAQMISKGE
jgi:hypothetical protein